MRRTRGPDPSSKATLWVTGPPVFSSAKCGNPIWVNPPPSSLPIPSLWVVPVHQPQAPQLGKTHETPLSLRAEGLLFLHGLETPLLSRSGGEKGLRGSGAGTLGCLTLVTQRTMGRQARLSMGFSKQEYWSGLPCPPPEDIPNPGIKPRSPTLQIDSLPAELPGKPKYWNG